MAINKIENYLREEKISAGEIWVHSSGIRYEIIAFSEGDYYNVENYEVSKKIEGPLHIAKAEKDKVYYIQLADGAVMKKGTKYLRSKNNFLENFKISE